MTEVADLPALTDDPWLNLATAIAMQAILDARCKSLYLSKPAREWLISREGLGWLEQLDVNPEVVMGWLGGGRTVR